MDMKFGQMTIVRRDGGCRPTLFLTRITNGVEGVQHAYLFL